MRRSLAAMLSLIFLGISVAPSLAFSVFDRGRLFHGPRTFTVVAATGLSALQAEVNSMAPGTWKLLSGTDPTSTLTTDSEIDDIVTANPGSSDFAPNTHAKAVFEAWNGAAYDPVGHNWYFTGGGHGDYGGNEVYRFSFETLSWTRMMAPSPLGTQISGGTFDGEFIPDVGPISAHTYAGFVWNPATNTVWNTGLRSGYNSYNPSSGNSVDPPIKAVWEFDPATASWSDYHTLIESENLYHPTAVYLPDTEEILVFWQPTSSSYRYASFFASDGTQTQANSGVKMDDVWSDTSTAVRVPNDGPASIAGHVFVISPQGIEEYSISGSTISVVGTTRSLPTLSPDPGKVYQDGMAWNSDDNLFYLWDGAQETYTWDPVTDTWASLANSDTTEAPAGPYGVGSSVLFTKWVYIEEVGAFAGIQAVDDGGVWIYKPPVAQAVVQTVTIDADSTATLPFTFATVFAEGEVPSVPSLDPTNLVNSDATCLSTWPDGSCRQAVFSGRADLSTTPISVDIYNVPGSSGTALAESDIATAVAALGETSIQLGSIGTVDLADLTGSPASVPIAGPEMIEAIYRTTGIGSNTHLMVEIDVRLYADDRLWIAFTVSNGLIGQDDKGDSFQADYVPTIKIDGSTVYDNGAATYNHNEFTSWTYDGWAGGDPGVYVKPDTVAWIASKMVQNFVYFGPSETTLDAIPQTYVQGDRGPFPAALGSGGYHDHIGVVTEVAAQCVTSLGDERACKGAEVEAKSITAFPMVLPAVDTLRAITPDEYPTWTINGDGAGGSSNWSTDGGTYTWDIAHHPHPAFIPYLMTADPRYLETMWDIASSCYLSLQDANGHGEARAMNIQERGISWCLTSVAQAIALSPDDDPRIASYQAWMANSFDEWTSDQALCHQWHRYLRHELYGHEHISGTPSPIMAAVVPAPLTAIAKYLRSCRISG